MSEDRYSFLVEWFDPTASLLRNYLFSFYTADNSVDMYDIKLQRTFLKRTKCNDIKPSDLYVGATLNVFSRQLNVVDFGDEHTRKLLSHSTEKTLALIKPHALTKISSILEALDKTQLMVVNFKMVKLTSDEARTLYGEHKGKPFFDTLIKMITSGPVLAMEIMGTNAIAKWRSLIGPTDPSVARAEAKDSIRAKFGEDVTNNAVHGSSSLEDARKEIHFFFAPDNINQGSRRNTAKLTNTTLAIIKPHIISSNMLGKMIGAIQDGGFSITAMRMFHLDQTSAEEFLEVYKTVVAEYYGMVTELISGPCLALELELTDGSAKSSVDSQQAFRAFCGPSDPEIARHLRPHTLRAKFGVDKIRNGVHCTDLPDDAELEVQYFFRILDH